MGFLDHTTNNIIVDAVLTDKGREKLARAAGLQITKYAFADTEVDYTILAKYGEIVGREKIEKNTPIFEANTANFIETRHKLLTDGSGGTVETITVTNTQTGAATLHTFTATFNNFDAGQTLSLRIYFTSTKWSLTTPGNLTAVLVGDSSSLLSVVTTTATMDAAGTGTMSRVFKQIATLLPGTHNASFEIVEDGGISSASSSANTNVSFTIT